MNTFAAYVILCQVDPQVFLDMDAQEKVHMFGGLVGVGRMVSSMLLVVY